MINNSLRRRNHADRRLDMTQSIHDIKEHHCGSGVRLDIYRTLGRLIQADFLQTELEGCLLGIGWH
jgi:hypothetical protein